MLHIHQSKSPEKVNVKTVSKLYEESVKNESDVNTDLYGYIQTNYAYEHECNYLKNRFNNFDVDVLTEYYKYFVDPNCRKFWANTPIGDGAGVPMSEWNKLTSSWEARGTKYGIVNNNNYFGATLDTVSNNPEEITQIDLLHSIEHFPELIDLPFDDERIPGDFYLPLTQCLTNIYELYCPKASKGIIISNCVFNNLTLFDMSTSDNYTYNYLYGPERAEHLSKIICPPTVSVINHGGYTQTYQSASGINIFFYAKCLNYPQDCSTWSLNGIRNGVFWVQDSAYDDWLDHPQIKAKATTGNFIVKKFSEYTGTDLVQKYMYTADLFDILYSNDAGEYFITSEILPTLLGYTPIAICVARTGFFGPNEPARWMALKYMEKSDPENGNNSQYINSIKFGHYNELIETVDDISLLYKDCTDDTIYLNTDYQTNTVNCPDIINSNNEWNLSELGTLNMYALTDIDGKSKTYKYLNLATAQTDWKTANTITNDSGSGYFPAACCCWRYHTVGTYQGSWYLPAIGELSMVIIYRTQIDNKLSQLNTLYPNDCVRKIPTSGGILSSTEKSKTGVYRVLFDTGDISYTLKSYNGVSVLAFLKF